MASAVKIKTHMLHQLQPVFIFLSSCQCCKVAINTQVAVDKGVNPVAQSMYVYLPSYHSPLSGVVEPLQQLDGGALSTATAPHQGQSLSLPHLQIQPLQDLHIRA